MGNTHENAPIRGERIEAQRASAGNRPAQSTSRRPPYSRSIRPGTRDVRAFINWEDAAASAKAGRAVVLLPPGADPAAFDWSCCHCADVWLRWRAHETTPDIVHRLSVAMVQAGADLVLVTETAGDPDCPLLAYRPREVQYAA